MGYYNARREDEVKVKYYQRPEWRLRPKIEYYPPVGYSAIVKKSYEWGNVLLIDNWFRGLAFDRRKNQVEEIRFYPHCFELIKRVR